MNTTALRLVIDTNIFIAIIGKKSPFRWIFDCLIQGKIALCISNEILFEYRKILAQKTNEQVAENVTPCF
jgi:putative PIN family toxin of toxin-antitoxin system